MSTFKINGISISASGNIVISNGKVMVDGKDVTPDSKEINIVVSGNVEKLEVDSCVRIMIVGEVGSVKTGSGDIEINGDVKGSVQTMSGDIKCGNISGDVSTMSGDIKNRK